MIARYLAILTLPAMILLCCNNQPTAAPSAPAVTQAPVSPLHPDSLIADSIRLARIQEAKADSVWLSNLETTAYTKIREFRQRQSARFRCDSFYFEKGPLINPAVTHLTTTLPVAGALRNTGCIGTS